MIIRPKSNVYDRSDPTTNRLSGYSYDASGNQLSTGNVFDAENRLAFANISGGTVEYFYDAQNKRVWQGNCTAGGNCQQGVVSTDTVTLFGADGRLVGTYQWSAAWTNTQTQVTVTFQGKQRAYFGGKLVAQNVGYMQSAVQDRLGSVGRYYPYGEERNSPPLANDQVKFATYTRDSGTGLDYADQRYYASTFGRFMTPDASQAAAKPPNPGTWNRFAYVQSDPVSFNDPTGLTIQPAEDPGQSVLYDPFDLISVGGGGDRGLDPGLLVLWSVFVALEPGGGGGGGDGGAPPQPTSSCLDGLKPRDVSFVSAHFGDALSLSLGSFDAMNAVFILAWSGVESGVGTSNIARQNNNFFSLRDCKWNNRTQTCVANRDPSHVAPWSNAVACGSFGGPVIGGTKNLGFACFTGDGFFTSASDAMYGGRGPSAVAIAQSMPGASPAQLAQAIANKGFCTEGNCLVGGYGRQVQSMYKELDAVVDCLFPWYIH